MGDGVYMFIRYPAQGGTNVEVMRQTCVLSKKHAENLRGRFLGISSKVEDYNYERHPRDSMALFWFPSSFDARRFFQSDTRLKQPDFPPPSGMCDVWTVVRYYTPQEEYNLLTFMVCEIRLTYSDLGTYKSEFSRPFAHLLLDYGAHPFVVQSMGAEDLRRHYCSLDTIVTVHLFRDREHLAQVKQDSRWYHLREKQAKMAWETYSVFTIDTFA